MSLVDPFAQLGAPRRFDLDLAALEKRHRELSRALHPDKFAQAGASERRGALEKAAEVNEAWRVVRDPIRRAEALFRLAGIEVGETSEPKPDPGFLMEMLEMREALAEARAKRKLGDVEKLGAEIAARRSKAEARLAAGFAAHGADGADGADCPEVRASLAPLVPLLGELRFYRRFLDEVCAIQDESLESEASP
jgi:molecular chaperone HscB